VALAFALAPFTRLRDVPLAPGRGVADRSRPVPIDSSDEEGQRYAPILIGDKSGFPWEWGCRGNAQRFGNWRRRDGRNEEGGDRGMNGEEDKEEDDVEVTQD